MSRSIAFTLMAAIALAAFFVGRTPQSKSDSRAETARSPSTAEQDAHVTRQAYEAVLAKLTEAERVIESQKREILDAAASRPEPAPDPEPVIAAVTSSAPRFVFEGQEDVLNKIDWNVLGEAMGKMPALLHELQGAAGAGDRPQLIAVSGQIQRWNGPLLSQAAHMADANLSGTGVNGIWTHPVLVVNQVYATLDQTDQKMTQAQTEQLKQIGDRFIAEEAQRVASNTDATFGLEDLIGETALRDRMYEAIDRILTEEQREILHPDASRGYTTSDLFSSALLWNTQVHPMKFKARTDFAGQLANVIITNEKVPAAHADAVRAMVTEWVDALPDALLNEMYTPVVDIRVMRVAHITDCAKEFLKLRKQLATRTPDADFQGRMKKGSGTVVWFRAE